MNRHTAASFDLGVKGDPRLLDSIQRRTPRPSGPGTSHVHGGTILAKRDPFVRDHSTHFDPWIETDDGTSWKIFCTPGYVCQRTLTKLDYFQPMNTYDLDFPTHLKRFPIEIDQALFVKVATNSAGEIFIDGEGGNGVELVVDDKDKESSAGFYYYKVAEILEPDEEFMSPKLVIYHGGCIIEHSLGGGSGLGFDPSIETDSEGASTVSVTPGILRRLDTGAVVEVTGTNTPIEADVDFVVVIEVGISGGEPATAEIKCIEEWETYPALGIYDATAPYNQLTLYIILARVITDPDSEEEPPVLILTEENPGNKVTIPSVVSGRYTWTGF